MAIKKRKRTVYICSDGIEYSTKRDAEYHEKDLAPNIRRMKADKFLFDLMGIDIDQVKKEKDPSEFWANTEDQWASVIEILREHIGCASDGIEYSEDFIRPLQALYNYFGEEKFQGLINYKI